MRFNGHIYERPPILLAPHLQQAEAAFPQDDTNHLLKIAHPAIIARYAKRAARLRTILTGTEWGSWDYEDNCSVLGDSRSTLTVITPGGNWQDLRDALMQTVDGYNPNLYCRSIRTKYHEEHLAPMRQLVVEFAPDARLIDQPWFFRVEASGLAIELSSFYTWLSDSKKLGATNKGGIVPIHPAKKITRMKVVLYGTRSTYNPWTYTTYQDKVNSDSWLGVPAGNAKGGCHTSNQRKDTASGDILYDIELPIEISSVPWNQFYRPDMPGVLDTLQEPGTSNTVYGTVAFSGIGTVTQ